MEKKSYEMAFDNVEFAEINENVLSACTTTCMHSHKGDCGPETK